MEKRDPVILRILDFARRDENIRAVVLSGSRANQNAPEDFLQDYDMALYARDMERAQQYKKERAWVSQFGSLVMLQQNDVGADAFIFLLQYDSGLRIDLSFHALSALPRDLKDDSLSVVLYDPDNLVKIPAVPHESSYFVQKPDRETWDATLNNLWWLQGYVAKELWRDEIPLAKELYDVWIMRQLRELLSWQAGANREWRVNVGHGGKWLGRLLPEDTYRQYLSLFCGSDKKEQWDALLRLGGFIRAVGRPLAHKLGYDYPAAYDAGMSAYIRKIHTLPQNARGFYDFCTGG